MPDRDNGGWGAAFGAFAKVCAEENPLIIAHGTFYGIPQNYNGDEGSGSTTLRPGHDPSDIWMAEAIRFLWPP